MSWEGAIKRMCLLRLKICDDDIPMDLILMLCASRETRERSPEAFLKQTKKFRFRELTSSRNSIWDMHLGKGRSTVCTILLHFSTTPLDLDNRKVNCVSNCFSQKSNLLQDLQKHTANHDCVSCISLAALTACRSSRRASTEEYMPIELPTTDKGTSRMQE